MIMLCCCGSCAHSGLGQSSVSEVGQSVSHGASNQLMAGLSELTGGAATAVNWPTKSVKSGRGLVWVSSPVRAGWLGRNVANFHTFHTDRTDDPPTVIFFPPTRKKERTNERRKEGKIESSRVESSLVNN